MDGGSGEREAERGASSDVLPAPRFPLPASIPGPPPGYSPELERVEIELLLEGVFRQHGFDFRSYAYASMRRRLWKRVEAEQLHNISELQARVLHDQDSMERLLLDLSVNVTAMFRDGSSPVAERPIDTAAR